MGFSQCWVCASLDPTYLIVGGRLIGVFIQKADETTATRYFHTDHLGSISVITNEAGGVVERLSVACPRVGAAEPGERLGQAPPTAAPIRRAPPTSESSRGFTGHEQLDSVGLIHMNGRVAACPRVGEAEPGEPFWRL